MQIEVRGPEAILDQIRLYMQDQLEKNGFRKGMKVGFSESVMTDYVKEDLIVCVELKQEAETVLLRVESEQDIPDLNQMWDAALVNYGVEVLEYLRNFAFDKERINREIR